MSGKYILIIHIKKSFLMNHNRDWGKLMVCENKTLPKFLLLFAKLAAFNFLDLLGAEDQHAVLKAAHLTCGGFSRSRGLGRLLPLVPCCWKNPKKGK